MRKFIKLFFLLPLFYFSSLSANDSYLTEHIEMDLPEQEFWTKEVYELEEGHSYEEWLYHHSSIKAGQVIVLAVDELDGEELTEIDDEFVIEIISEVHDEDIEDISNIDRAYASMLLCANNEGVKAAFLSRAEDEMIVKSWAEDGRRVGFGRFLLTQKAFHALVYIRWGENCVNQVDQERWVEALKEAHVVS